MPTEDSRLSESPVQKPAPTIAISVDRQPDDSVLNEAMAMACGWRWYVPSEAGALRDWAMLLPPDAFLEELKPIEEAEIGERERGRPRLPDYCTDRNSLPEIYAALLVAGAKAKFLRYYVAMHRRNGAVSTWSMITGCPRLQVIAALRALEKWPEEWVVEESHTPR